MTVETLTKVLSALPEGVELLFNSDGNTYNIDSVEFTQVGDDGPLNATLYGTVRD